MKAKKFIDKDRIGETDLHVIDKSMGVLSGQITALSAYENYRLVIQQETSSKGGANLSNFQFSIVTENGEVLQAQGGITLIDSFKFGELTIEVAGADLAKLHS